MISELFTAGIMVSWGFLHSILASNPVKKKFKVDPFNQRYRIFFNVVSIITLMYLELIISSFLRPGAIQLGPILDRSIIQAQILYTVLFYSGIIIFIGVLIQVNPLKLLGVIRENPDDIKLGGFYRFSRHPMYAGLLLIFLANLLISADSVSLTKTTGYILYIIIGARFEERRLKKNIEQYEIMFTKGFFFPYRLKHFKIIFKKD
ncbi:hypothetical protein LCGC14_2038090 [marine sediment metagenome]|uniref:NnrU domain-containing protein n=1 Tax=marine sediment metagenome TaxID=412755 RepID=A0A0F9ESJ3_9ZZZZ